MELDSLIGPIAIVSCGVVLGAGLLGGIGHPITNREWFLLLGIPVYLVMMTRLVEWFDHTMRQSTTTQEDES